jgi:hypothetical protein
VAKPRSKPKPPETADEAVAQGYTAVSETTDNSNGRKFMPLSDDQIRQLLGKTRTKNQYVDLMSQFVNSGEVGICANDEFVAIADKKAATIKQGFEAAKDKKEVADGADKVKVVVSGEKGQEKVFLINLALAGAVAPEAVAA